MDKVTHILPLWYRLLIAGAMPFVPIILHIRDLYHDTKEYFNGHTGDEVARAQDWAHKQAVLRAEIHADNMED